MASIGVEHPSRGFQSPGLAFSNLAGDIEALTEGESFGTELIKMPYFRAWLRGALLSAVPNDSKLAGCVQKAVSAKQLSDAPEPLSLAALEQLWTESQWPPPPSPAGGDTTAAPIAAASGITGGVSPYAFLALDHACDVEFEGVVYPSAEHAFQAAKAMSDNRNFYKDKTLPASQARTEGRKLKENGLQRPDWYEVREEVMRTVQRAKFSEPQLRAKLYATLPRPIEASWKTYDDDVDNFWGKDGKNMFGKIMMEVRAEVASSEAAGGDAAGILSKMGGERKAELLRPSKRMSLLGYDQDHFSDGRV